MNKLLLSVFAMLIASFGVANAGIEITTVNVEQPANDTLLFALPVDVNVYQDIQNYPDNQTDMRMMKFQPEYLVTALDFTKGDTNKGTATLPANAKVIGLGLDGYDVSTPAHARYLDVTAWCRNVPRDKMELDNLEAPDGYKIWGPVGDLFIDTLTYDGTRHVVGCPGYKSEFDPNSTAENPATLVEIPFNNPDENGRFAPFWYKGENIYLTLWMCNTEDELMKYRYMAFDDAEAEIASLMRSGRFCFNNETYEWLLSLGYTLMYELPTHRLPAFRAPYYTNDVRITFSDQVADVELQDANGNVIAPAEDGNYYSLDHTMAYTLVVDGSEGKEVCFDNIYTDVDINVNKGATAVDEVNVKKAIASVAYYNLAGQQSAQPIDGVNIVVTTYTDGTRTTAKVIK